MTGFDDCIYTKRAGRGKGYPVMEIAGKPYNISKLVIGEQLRAGEIVRHKCDNPRCINPLHLEKGTPADNMEDKRIRGRAAKKLTQEKATAIYNDPRSNRKIAADYGVCHATVGEIKRGLIWRDSAKALNEAIRGG